MTRKEIRDDVLRKVWFEDPTKAPSYVIADVVIEINRALQTVWSLPGREWFRRQPIEVPIVSGTNRYELPATLQSVLGVSRLNGASLRPVDSQSDIEHYARRYLGESSETPGTPAVYWVEMLASGASPDSAAAFLWLAPSPNADGTLTIQVSTEAPIYTAADLTDEEQVIPMPHGYVESLFLPVARFYASRSHWFKDAAKLEELRTDATSAFNALGLVAPWEIKQEPATPASR